MVRGKDTISCDQGGGFETYSVNNAQKYKADASAQAGNGREAKERGYCGGY